MPEIVAFLIMVVAYFAVVWALLRVLTSWSPQEVLVRAAVITLVCNAPLLLGGAAALVLYALVAVVVMRVLVAYDASFLAAVLPIVAGTVTMFCVGLALS